MRLIDADNINTEDVIGGQNEFANDIRMAMKDLINSQPTAYDVDNVIEKLEKRLSYYSNKIDETKIDITEDIRHVNYYDYKGRGKGIIEAIEIIKRGGTNG
jgi:methylthioribose-1-phosphate isomerase